MNSDERISLANRYIRDVAMPKSALIALRDAAEATSKRGYGAVVTSEDVESAVWKLIGRT